MFRAGLFLAVGSLWASGPARAGVADLLPLLTGDLHGVITPVPERPLPWRTSWIQSDRDAARRTGALEISGQDLKLRVALDYDVVQRRLGWKVDEGRVDLTSWLPALARRPGLEALAGMEATGALEIAGEGLVALSDGAVSGRWSMEWLNGKLADTAQGWSLEKVELRAGGDAAQLASGNAFVSLAVGAIATSRFGARNFSAKAALVNFTRARVESADVEIAGGHVAAEPFELQLADPKPEVTFQMKSVGLQDLIVFAPTALTDARGRISGTLKLAWSSAAGVQVGGGKLALDDSEPTTVKLASKPGFLTAGVPERFELLPTRIGWLSRWFSSPNPGYDTLKNIETGSQGLRVSELNVTLSPEGDANGRSATVFVRARPEEGGAVVDQVTFTINVNGPLAAVLRMGMQQDISFQIR